MICLIWSLSYRRSWITAPAGNICPSICLCDAILRLESEQGICLYSAAWWSG
ncbi:hypothetical protein B0H17DRAFT_1039852 [Mycena rosella]|uniref:Uncharacterized protein n=1 Tax=Mycena rosella TaxID=1033263 RepID=A0AAD7GST0_MYCRO|nr:hypothetical protein B0H17DRAFT_1039852 [Mycena rosella]